jgi:hypothetical protein
MLSRWRSADDRGVEDVAGYRVLRTAGRGDRARLLLGFDEGDTVVLKVTSADDRGAAVEVEALERSAGEHVVQLLDVSVDAEQTVLVLERLTKGTLADLLERRGGLDAGEAVTVLAPVATTLERLHAAGVAHSRLSLAAICFADDGAPTLTGFGGAEFFAPGSPDVVRETVPGVLADRAALHEIASIVLGRVVGARAEAARRLAAELSASSLSELAERLFALSPAGAVRFDDPGGEVSSARVGVPLPGNAAEAVDPAVLPPWLRALAPEWIADRLEEPWAGVAATWSGWEARRRRLAVAVVAASVAGLAALALVPAAPAASSDEGAPVATATPVPSAAAEPGLPEDPVEAAVLLLELRDRCVRDLSVLCLDDVVQPDSSAQADDLAVVRAIQAGAEYPEVVIAPGEPVLVELLGDAALLDLPAGSDPASVLLMRTTDGWRIRDYLDAPAVRPSP